MTAMVLVKKSSLGKRRRTGARMTRAGPRRALPALPANLRGIARIGGFYGRFAGANAELKFLDTAKGLTVFALAGVVFDESLNIIPQGSTESNRVGRKVVVKHIHFRGLVQSGVATTASTTDQVYRIIVYCDKQTNGAVAAVTDILESATVLSHYNLANSGRFRILYDQMRGLPINAMAQTAAGTFTSVATDFKWEIKLRVSIPLEFDNTFADGRLTTIRSNNIGIIGLSFSDTGPPLIQYVCRIRYSDVN